MGRIGEPRECKYCNKLAARSIIKGRDKGWLRTCGSPECLTAQYKDAHVNRAKKVRRYARCKDCGQLYTTTSANQKWCTICVPSKKWRCIRYRYGLNYPKWLVIFNRQNGKCALCNNNKPTVVDHDHKTGEIRGLLCGSCNFLVAAIDRGPVWFNKALNYVRGMK